MSKIRAGQVERQTKETTIRCSLNLAPGKITIKTGIGFFDHMLNSLASYAGFSLNLEAQGDLHVDHHHTVEDVGLVLGEALAQTLGNYDSHQRFGSALTPMDESLAEAALDLGRRPFLYFSVNWPQHKTGDFELCLVEEFFRAFCQKAGATLHILGRHGQNSHHLAEAIFKAVGQSLKKACAHRPEGVLSTKGLL